MWYTFKVGDLNVGDGPAGDKLADLRLLVDKHKISVFTGQEFGDRADVVRAFLRHYPHWKVVWNSSKNKYRDVPIMYDSTVWKRTFWTQVRVFIGYLGPKGAGGDNPGFKSLNIVRLKHRKSKRVVQFQTHHTIASAFNPHVRGAEHERRVRAYTRQISTFFGHAVKSKHAVIGSGDWNAEKSNRIIKHHTPARWRWVSSTDTFRNKTIDMFGYIIKPYLRAHGAYVVETSGSKKRDDHRAVVASFSIRS